MTTKAGVPTREQIIQLFKSGGYLSLRYHGVASRLGTEPDETLRVMHHLHDDGVLYRQCGYYHLNPPHLWRK